MLRGDLGQELGRRVAAAVDAAFALPITADEALIRPASPDRGADYQCNAAMGLAKRLGRPSREIADEITAHLSAGDSAGDLVEPPTVAGPGFINFTLRRDWLQRHVTELATDPRIGVPVASQRRFVVDYSSPNVAKEMHVGHLRTTNIGDAIVRMLTFQGHEVIRRNHLGDWGTPFGMLLEHMVDEGWTRDGGPEHTISDLNAFYQEARKKFEADAMFAERARQRVVALQGGDERTLALWRDLVAESQRHFQRVYDTMGVLLTPDDSIGESFYNPYLADTVAELTVGGLARDSEGALCVFPTGFTGRGGDPLPLIVRKSDGGYTYSTTDLAAVRYWTRERGATDLVYVVGTPQKLHFQMVFTVGEEAGWLGDGRRAVHVSFGSVLGEDGRMLRTREGGTVKLIDLLTEAVERAGAIVAERSDFDDEQRYRLAHAVGIGAVKYADLATDRDKDYVFAWDRMLAMDGNTSVYLQYANVRIRSVIRRAGGEPSEGASILLAEPAERALALKLAQFPAAVVAATSEFHPHKLCGYLYETATAFTGFYESCPILGAPSDELRRSRLALSALTSRVLTLGLGLLGIEAPDRL